MNEKIIARFWRRVDKNGAQVVEIRKRYATETGRALALEFGICPGAVTAICSGKTWKHVGGPRIKKLVPTNRKLSNAQAAEIRTRLEMGEKVSTLVREFGVKSTTIYKIYHGHQYRSDDPLPKRILTNQKLNDTKAIEIRLRFTAGEKVHDLVLEFGVSRTTIYRTLRRNPC